MIAMRYGTGGELARNGGSGTTQIDLLWTNPNPDSSFAAQTVSIDLSSYDAILVQMRNVYNGGIRGMGIVLKESINHSVGVFGTSETKTFRRSVNASDTGVTFGAGYNGENSSSNAAIPLLIYGIKF